MTDIDRSAPVLVTGATGYVAGLLVKKLLEEGFTVHAPVRNPDNHEKLKYLNGIADASSGSIAYFKADLLEEGSYDEAMNGCELVFHTASPFVLNVKDPQKELIEPAQLGTRNVLDSATRAGIKRVVLTSSVMAIYGDNIDINSVPGDVFTEEHWNTTSTLEHNAYAYSKTLAEKEAWALQSKQSAWDLVAINPSLVIGPGINPYATSESFNIIKQMGNGKLKQGTPRFGLAAVDVRDVADAHYQAGFTPAAEGRHIVSGYNTDMLELAGTLLDKFGKDYPIPRKALPKWLIWTIGPLLDKSLTRKTVTCNVNIPIALDHSKSVKALGLRYRPLQESMEDFFQQMIDSGRLKAR